ncbi:hypothetical protein [Paraburkholderia sp. RL17-337-BIB-A]|uniref:hypothetical protein n=1 Tax=Paraburkholderia sp. RL17-337-BIB-A TaxID=3031636 RepID=UPI0038B7B4CF
MSQNKELFAVIRRIVAHIDTFREEPNFTNELIRRRNRVVTPLVSNSDFLRNLAHIIAYAHADSSRVTNMIDSNGYDEVWFDYDVDAVAALNPCDVVEEHWETTLSPIMNGSKAYFVVMAARAIQRVGAISTLFNDSIPTRIQTGADIPAFWKGFAGLKNQMKEHGVPYLSSVTSLSHMLLHLGYDCVKPDVIVMRVAMKLGIVTEKEAKTDKGLKKVARLLQEYALEYEIRPSEIDMYFLIQEGQSEAMTWVRPNFAPVYDLASLPALPEIRSSVSLEPEPAM